MKEILLIIFIMLSWNKISNSQEKIEIPKDFELINSEINTIDDYPHVFTIDTLNHYFNGYLIVEVNNDVKLFDKTHYPTNVYWIESLYDKNL